MRKGGYVLGAFFASKKKPQNWTKHILRTRKDKRGAIA